MPRLLSNEVENMSHQLSRREFVQSSLALSGAIAASGKSSFSAEPVTVANVKSSAVDLAPFFHPPAEFATDFGNYTSPLKFADGTPVRDAVDWPKRRQEILKTWHEFMGPWPEMIEKPKIEYLEK